MLSAFVSSGVTFFCVRVSVYMNVCAFMYVLDHACVIVCTFVHTSVCACENVCPYVHVCNLYMGVCGVCVCVCVFLFSGQVRRSCRMMSSLVTFSASCSCSVKDTTQVCISSLQ